MDIVEAGKTESTMFLLRRKGYFYVQYLDETENRFRRISTGSTRQREALKFLTEFKEKLAERPKSNFKTLSAFADEYVGYLAKTHSVKYTRDAKAAFRKLQDFTGDVPLIKETKNATLKDISLCGFNTGMRLSEILNLEWNAVSFSERTITVSNTESFTTKNKREQVIPINETLFAMLERRKPKVLSIDGNNLVFGKTRFVPFSVNYVSRKFKEATKSWTLRQAAYSFPSTQFRIGSFAARMFNQDGSGTSRT